MHQLIDELKSVSGVIGACTYSPQNGLQESNLPGIFKPEKLAAIGRQFDGANWLIGVRHPHGSRTAITRLKLNGKGFSSAGPP